MINKRRLLQITDAMRGDAAEIAEMIETVALKRRLAGSPARCRDNRIRAIHGSLAIEGNMLSLKQTAAVMNGKCVLAPPQDVAEVKNACETYERLDDLEPYCVDDLLVAHGVMTRDLLEESGAFRSGNVGVVDGEGNILHFGTLPQYVPESVERLLNWTKDSDLHMLIRSCVFHYEFELIHPFMDGNGRVGRLWHTLLLSRWNSLFAWLPVESIIHDRQQEYYAAINTSNSAGESTAFIEFMLSAIKMALAEAAAEM